MYSYQASAVTKPQATQCSKPAMLHLFDKAPLCTAKYQQQGGIRFSQCMILNPKPSINTYHTNPQQLTWFTVQAYKACSYHPDRLGTSVVMERN